MVHLLWSAKHSGDDLLHSGDLLLHARGPNLQRPELSLQYAQFLPTVYTLSDR